MVVSPYWKVRKRSFYIYTVGFGLLCVASGFGLHIAYLKYTTLAFIPSLLAAAMGIWKFFNTAYVERKEKDETKNNLT